MANEDAGEYLRRIGAPLSAIAALVLVACLIWSWTAGGRAHLPFYASVFLWISVGALAFGVAFVLCGIFPNFLFLIDRISTWVGKTFAWFIVILTLVASYEIFVRKLFRAPTTWAFDASWMLYGSMFMMAGAYALARNGHVRGDFLYRSWRPRIQATMDLVLYFLFFVPGMIAFVYSGFDEASYSLSINEKSMFSPFGLIIWPIKMLIPITGVLMLMQGLAEVIRCIMCLKTGEWPQRLHDAEELDKLILEEAERKRKAEEEAPAGRTA